MTWLRAESLERVQAHAAPGWPGASLLASIGFTVAHGTARADGRTRFVLLLQSALAPWLGPKGSD